jgi:hypothetical protein
MRFLDTREEILTLVTGFGLRLRKDGFWVFARGLMLFCLLHVLMRGGVQKRCEDATRDAARKVGGICCLRLQLYV